MRLKKRVMYATLILLTLFILGNPGEHRFLQAVSNDFGSIHHGAEISPTELTSIGHSSYRSYLLFSFYEYSFGTISVQYYGVCFMTFYHGNSSDTHPPIPEEAPIQS